MNNTALITGASSGMGLEYARIHASRGGDLVLVALPCEGLSLVKENLEKDYGVQVMIFESDLSSPTSSQELFNLIESQNISIDYLINNAGFGDFNLFVDSNWERQEKMIKLNVLALVHLTHLFLPGMVKRGRGRILNMASTASFQPGPTMSIYFATKAFVLNFSEALANETQGTGVTITAVCPGSTTTRFNKLAANGKELKKSNKKRPSPNEVANFGYDAMLKGKTIAIHGLKNRFIVFAIRFLPRKSVVSAARKIQESKFYKSSL